MIIRRLLICFPCILFVACSAGTVFTKDYSGVAITGVRLYAWRGMATVESGDGEGENIGYIDLIEPNLDKALEERGFRQVDGDKAEIAVSVHLKLQNALEIEKRYRKQYEGIFNQTERNVFEGESSALLPDVESPLYGGQQRGTVVLTIYNAKTGQRLRKGEATIIFPENPDDKKQLTHVRKTLQRLVDKLFD